MDSQGQHGEHDDDAVSCNVEHSHLGGAACAHTHDVTTCNNPTCCDTAHDEALEAELRRERERFDIIFQNTTVSVWDYVFETKQIIQPERSRELHGFDTVVDNVPDSLIESGFVHPDYVQSFRDMYDSLFAGEKRVEGVFRVQTADRDGYWYEHIRYTALQDASGKSYAAVGMSTDVTEEMESKQAVQRWKELLADTMGDEGAIVDFNLSADTFVSIENSTAEKQVGWSKYKFDDYISAYVKKFVHISDAETVKQTLQRAKLLTEFMDGKREFSLEYRMQYAGRLHWVRLVAVLKRLERDAIHIILFHMDITSQKEKELELQYKADSDDLTGLLNRRAFMEQSQKMLSQYADQTHALAVLDLDEFKSINDSFGHMTGDRMLRHVGMSIANLLSQADDHALASRLSGDEFAIMFCDRDRLGVQRFLQALLEKLVNPEMEGIRLSASAGVALFPKNGKTYDELYLAADRALYYAKRHHKSSVCFYDNLWREGTETLQRRQQFLSDTFSGGMMGGYIEEGFPFYFVDESMLQWLGYASEADFVRDIDGLIDNCMHPDDREYVGQAVDQQLAHGDRYEVDYRMRKQDGSYIWVHDVGERTVAPDGREAITSVCYDITVEKEHANVIQSLVEDANGGIALYSIDSDGAATLLFASEGVCRLAHYTEEEYSSLCQKDALNMVYEMDREVVQATIKKTIEEDVVHSLSFRVLSREGGYTWITGTFSRYGVEQGKPVIRAVYMPLPMQYELQLQTLDSDSLSVYVIDKYTKEVYFANSASFDLHNIAHQDITGKKCYQLYFDQPSECENCILDIAPTHDGKPFQYENDGRTLSIEVQERRWNGKDIVIVYGRDITDEALAKKRQDELLNHIPGGVCLSRVRDGSFEPIMFNNALERVLGIDRSLEEVDPFEFIETYLHKDDRGKLKEFLRECGAAPGDNYGCRYRIWNCDKGAYTWIETHVSTVAQNGELMAYSTYTDVTEAQQVQESLEQNQKMMAARLELERKKLEGSDHNLLFYYVANVTRNEIVEYRSNMGGTPAMHAGVSLDAFVQAVYKRLTFQTDIDRIEPRYQQERLLSRYRLGNQQEEYSTQMALPNGQVVWTRHTLQLLSDPYTGEVMLYEYVYNITREQISEMLLKLELTNGYEAIGLLIVKEDQFTILEFNSGKQPTELVMSFSDYINEYAATCVYPEDRQRYCKHYLGRDYANEPPMTTEIVYRAIADGEVEFYKGTLYLYEEDGKRFCALIRRNYTDVVRAEEEEKQRLAEALEKAEEAGRAKNEFLARMSHDMRTPMNAIIGLAALTLDAAEDAVEVRSNMAKMQTASDFLLSLVNDILDMSKIEDRSLTLNLGPYPYREFLLNMRTTFLPQCEAKNIRLIFEEPGVSPMVLCDKKRLNQVFYNIFSNAVKYTPEGGTIKYCVRNLRFDDDRLSADYVVRDSGIGMSEEYQKRMFEPFTRENNEYTAELQGSGLGLGIVKQLVELMGGSIQIASKKGVGTTVVVHLEFECLSKHEEETSDKRALKSHDTLRGKTVLLAEDHPINAEITMKLLRGQGMSILHAENGRVALEMFRASDPGSIEIILMDIRMPEMDGLEAARAIRALNRPDAKTVPIIALSANAYAEDVQMSIDAGMNTHLSKPMNLEQLYRAMTELLEQNE